MENMGKHEYMESMNVKTWMLFLMWKKEDFYTHRQKTKQNKTKPDWPILIFFSLRYGKQTYFFLCLTGRPLKFLLFPFCSLPVYPYPEEIVCDVLKNDKQFLTFISSQQLEGEDEKHITFVVCPDPRFCIGGLRCSFFALTHFLLIRLKNKISHCWCCEILDRSEALFS